jgi:hypothetical protein
MGSKVRVTGNVKFYIVRSKLPTYQVTFNNNSGTSTSKAYSKLNMRVPKNTVITLPSCASVTGYENLGWTTAKGKTTPLYKMGSKVRVTGNVKFYIVRSKLPTYQVTFNNNSGTSTSKAYSKLNKTVQKYTTITLPSCGTVSGYENVGWTTSKGKTTPLYKIGSTYQVTGNTSFYLVRRKIVYYSAQFFYTTGSTNAAYKALAKKVTSGTTITMPSLPAKTGYTGVGWATTKNASTAKYTVGKTYTVKGNVSFYAVYKATIQVSYCSNDGSKVYKTVSVGKGQTLTLSGLKNPSGYTMLGWSLTPGQTTNPQYMVREGLVVNRTMKLYAVMYPHSAENDYTAEDLPQPDLRKYSKVIFVGDSRTYQMQMTLQNQFDASLTEGVSFVALNGSGLSWLKSSGYAQLISEIGTGGTQQKPIAIIFNHGINNLSDSAATVTYMKTLAEELTSKNCKLFYMSVNPHNNAICTNRGLTVGTEAAARAFNQAIKTGLCTGGSYTYIDTYSYLSKNGYSMDQGAGVDNGYDDGLHYSVKTSKRIYAYCISVINRA